MLSKAVEEVRCVNIQKPDELKMQIEQILANEPTVSTNTAVMENITHTERDVPPT